MCDREDDLLADSMGAKELARFIGPRLGYALDQVLGSDNDK